MGINLKRTLQVTGIIAPMLISGGALASNVYKQDAHKYSSLQVIEDRGGESVERYLPKQKQSDDRMKKNFHERQSRKLIDAHFPVVTKSMTVGRVTEEEAAEVPYQMATKPMFIIGYDPVSLNWLASNKDMLIDKKAVGFVVNVSNKEELKEIHARVGNQLYIQPLPGDQLAEHLKIQHYPFYMDNQGVMR